MEDLTEDMRRELVGVINAEPGSRAELEKHYGKVWDTAEMGADFSGIAFMAPFIVVTRKSDGVRGSLMFQHEPRFYFSFTAD